MNEIIIQGSALAGLVNLFTYLTSKYIFPRWGKTGVQCIVGFFALVGALYLSYSQYLPGLKEIVVALVGIYSVAVTLYETLWSKLGN